MHAGRAFASLKEVQTAVILMYRIALRDSEACRKTQEQSLLRLPAKFGLEPAIRHETIGHRPSFSVDKFQMRPLAMSCIMHGAIIASTCKYVVEDICSSSLVYLSCS